MNTNTIVILLLLFINDNLKDVFGIPVTPCPHIFLYKFDENLWHGEIHLQIAPAAKRANLKVRYSVAYSITKEQKGEIIFISNKSDMEHSIHNNLPLKLVYKLTFPFQQVLPVVETIVLNDQVQCEGVPDPNRKIAISFTHNVAWQPDTSQTESQKPAVQQSQIPQPTLIPPVTFPPTIQIPDKNQAFPVATSVSTQDVSQICGIPPKAIVQLIVNGEPAGLQPWLVSLYEGTRLNYEYFCAGNLITNKHVITAAHCVNGKKNIYMKVGAKSLTSTIERNSKIRTNEKIYINEEYVHPSSHGDIAIILMNEPVTFASNIQPLCLWNPTFTDTDTDIIGKIGIIVGWGKNENGDPEPDEPKKARVRVVTQQACAQKDLLKNIISDKTFCAEGATHFAGPCLGDSGGALTIIVNKRYTIRGIISATVGDQNSGICDVENYYSVYADVAKFMSWINNVLSKD